MAGTSSLVFLWVWLYCVFAFISCCLGSFLTYICVFVHFLDEERRGGLSILYGT